MTKFLKFKRSTKINSQIKEEFKANSKLNRKLD